MLRRLLRLSLSVAVVAGAVTVAVTVPGIAPPVPAALAATNGFTGLTPARLLDTREGNGAPAAAVGPGGIVNLQVTGRGGVPTTGVSAVVLNVTVTGPTASSYVTVWPSGEARPTASNLNFVAGQTAPNLVIVKVGAGGRVSLYNLAGSVQLIADVSGWYSTSSQLVPTSPSRLLDTRSGLGGVTGPTSGEVAVQVAGRAGVPVGATSVVMNVTVTEPSSNGFLTVWANGGSRPNASNLNFVTGQTIPNLVIAQIGTEGKIKYYGNVSRVHVIIDVLGYMTTAVELTAALDRVDCSLYCDFSERTASVQGQPRYNSIAEASGCSTSSPEWSEYNLGRQWGTLATTLTFDDITSTATSKMRFRILGDGAVLVNQTISFGQAVNVTANVTNVLRIRFEVLNANASSSTCSFNPIFATPRLLLAAGATFPSNPEFLPVAPARILDTRNGTGAGLGRVPGNGQIELQVLGRGGIPESGVGAVVMNLTVTEPELAGYLTVWPTGQARPVASNVNFTAGLTVPNLVVVPIGAGGRVNILNFGGRSHVIADVLGWYAGTADARPAQVSLTETLDRVDCSLYCDFSERTASVQGQPRYNSIAEASGCSTSSPEWSEYNLGRQWGTLATTLTFDDITSTATSKMRFRILGDGAVLVNQTISFGQAVNVTANVTNVLRIRFEVLNANASSSTCSFNPIFATPTLSR